MAKTRWQDAPQGEAHGPIFEYVDTVESAQSDIYQRFLKYAYLYDPHNGCGFTGASFSMDPWSRVSSMDSQVTENGCASSVDTVTALIARQKTRVRFMTDGGDWKTQRRARHLEWYVEGLMKSLRVHEIAQECFKDAAIFGTALVKVYADGDKICVERVLVDEIVVDEGECKTAAPRQMHQRKLVDRRVLAAAFPEKREEIMLAQSSDTGWSRTKWANYRPLERDQLVVVESWQLPNGDEPGRHVIAGDGFTVVDEEWAKPWFPFAKMVWSQAPTGYYGIGLIARIAGHQRALNKLNWQVDTQLDKTAVPTTYVRPGDARVSTMHVNRAGMFVPIKGDMPQTVVPEAVGGEIFKRMADVKSSMFEESGVSRLAASSLKPAGLESAVAMREYKDSTTERFAIQEQAFERFNLDIAWLAVDVAKELGDSAPDVWYIRGNKRIRWRDVDMGEVRVQMEAASSIARTPAGRTQTVIEWAQAGVITQDEARRLLQHPDLERAMSLYTAALEDIERTIDEVLDGEQLVPEPYQNLKMGVWRMQQAYLKALADGAPEEILEAMRAWTVQAAWILNPPQPAPDPMGGMGLPVSSGTQPAPGAALGAGAAPGSIYPVMGPPPAESLGSAFSPQAMQIAPQG